MAWRCRKAQLETERSMSGVSMERLSCPKFVTRVRVPSMFNEVGIWLQFMGRPCFREAIAFVKGLAPGGCGYIQGLSGSGKSYLLATLAAFLSLETDAQAQAVYLGGCYFTETPMEVLKCSLGVTFGGDEAIVKEVMGIKTCDSLVHWLKNRPEQFYFMLDDADFVYNARAEERKQLLNAVADKIVLVCCTGPCGTFLVDGDVSYFPLMEGFDSEEATYFLQHAGMQMQPELLHCTGYVPRLLDRHCRGDLLGLLVGYYFTEQIDEFLVKLTNQDWRQVLDVLAGTKLEQDVPKDVSGGFLYRNKAGRGACLCDAMKNHACLRAIQITTLDLEEVLQAWLKPVLAEGDEKDMVEAPWNCTLAVATVLRLREVVHLGVIGQSMVSRIVQALAEWWTPCWENTLYLNSKLMAWPIITVAMYGKAFVLQAGIREDLEPQRNYEKKQKFLRRVSESNIMGLMPCQTYFVWIGCFGKRVKDGGVVIPYADHVDVFINYGQLDPLLTPLEKKFQVPVRRSLPCYHMVDDQRCNRRALPRSILCRKHLSSTKCSA